MTSNSVWAVMILVMFMGAGWVLAFIHEGKDAAIGAALPKLDLAVNPYVLRECSPQPIHAPSTRGDATLGCYTFKLFMLTGNISITIPVSQCEEFEYSSKSFL